MKRGNGWQKIPLHYGGIIRRYYCFMEGYSIDIGTGIYVILSEGKNININKSIYLFSFLYFSK